MPGLVTGVAATVLALAMTACTASNGPPNTGTGSRALPAAASSPPGREPSSPRVFSLLANDHLVVADITSGAVLAELTLGAPASLISGMHGMAMSRDSRTLFVLVNEANGHGLIVAVDVAALKVTATFDPGPGLEYRGLAVGPRTGRLFLFADQGGDALVRVVDPTGGQATQTWPARASGGRSWLIYQGAVASDESALYISYHGPDTTGVDRFAIHPTGLSRCGIAASAESGCFRTHGSFTLRDGELFAATGGSPVLVLDPVTGAQRGQYDLQLEGNHLMEFAIPAAGGGLYAVGSCGYTGGLAAVDLATGRTRVLVQPRTLGAICGERIAALSDGSRLVVAKTAIPAPNLIPGALVVLSNDGKTIRTIPTSAEPIDLLLF